jgi:hypothetical protein
VAAAAVVALTVLTVYVQVDRLGLAYVSLNQHERHLDVIEGEAGNPWQYRVLSEYVVHGQPLGLGAVGVERPHTVAFVAMRVVQNALIFSLCLLVYARLGYSRDTAVLGLGLVAFAFTQALHDSDLSFNTYTDVLAYVAVVLLLLDERPRWAVALTPLAVLNRETALLIPVLIVALSGGFRDARALRLGAAALVLGGAAYLAPRLFYGTDRPMAFSYGREIGLDMLAFNMRALTLRQVALTCGAIAVLACAGWSCADPVSRKLLWVLAVPWVAIHLVGSIVAETRLLLVPIVVVAVPLALALAGRARGTGGRAAERPGMAPPGARPPRTAAPWDAKPAGAPRDVATGRR